VKPPECLDYLVSLVKERWPTYGPDRVMFELANAFGVHVSRSTICRSLERLAEPPCPPMTPTPKPNWRFYEKKRPHVLWHGDAHLGKRLPDGRHLWQATLFDDCSRGIVGDHLSFENDTRGLVRALIQAIRAWRVLPLLLELDNGSECKNRLVKAFCRNVGIYLFHTKPYHPQSNGKQERSFRSGQEEFWRSLQTTDIEEIRRLREGFVLRWNTERGQKALGGLPPSTRVTEGNRRDIDYEHLEDLARAPLGTRVVDRHGHIAYMGNTIPVGRELAGSKADLVLTLEGAEIRVDGDMVGRFDYWSTTKNYAEWRGD